MFGAIAIALAAAQAPVQIPPVAGPAAKACTSPAHHAFDFWVGEWTVTQTGKSQQVANSKIERLYGDCVMVRMTYTPNADGSVRQFGEQSVDFGQSWSPSFDFTYRAKAPAR